MNPLPPLTTEFALRIEELVSPTPSDVPDLDPITRIYLVESLYSFRIASFLSSTITLGCASECAILNLIDAYATALPKTHGDALKKKTQGK